MGPYTVGQSPPYYNPVGYQYSDGTLIVSFDEYSQAGPVYNSSNPNQPAVYSQWAAPPAVESMYPDVIYVNNTDDWTLRPSVGMKLSRPVTILGFEMEPNWGYPTSSTITYFSAGSQVASVSVDFPFQSATNSQPGGGSAQLIAINSPVPFDSVVIGNPDELAFAIANLRYGPVAGLTITCTPNPVMRGVQTTCKATDNANQPVQATNWVFSSTDPQLEYTTPPRGVTSSTWQGPMALSGQVRASASGGRSGTTQLVVQNRSWDASKLAFPTVGNKGQGPAGNNVLNARVLFDAPATFGEVGYGVHWLDVSSNFNSKFQAITTGPNTGLTYTLGIPFDMRSEVAINAAAMTSTSKWASYHGTSRTTTTVNGVTTTWCSKSDVAGLLTPVQQHEGAVPYPTSHVQTSYDGYVLSLNLIVEPWVGTDVPTQDELKIMKERADAAAYNYSNGITHSLVGNPINLTCKLRYTP